MRQRLLRWAGLGALVFIAATLLPVLLLRFVDPWTSAVMVGDRAKAVWRGDFAYRNRYDWVPLESISPQLALAVIAAEDQQFPFHVGFDFVSIREAVRHNARSARKRGASTITQQVAKNMFLWRGRSWWRKVLEAWFTVLIELCWTKERILEIYLNVAEMGPGTFGAEAAARRYFKKSAAHLSRDEAALLAAVLPNPHRFSVESPSRYVRVRRDKILSQMRALGGAGYLEQLADDRASPVERAAPRRR
ncbi:MAG: monofunctional biosynthetic peptidoglycan transglycosylase [Steroidobacteraceae bacterium]|nr:monofunctional biosynthetic peptidoglycan transglycosylase [Steroidobacteraceae bacterium]MDW8260166.1 monofunctional biosynthetic peptidoglycan transglycosylase [Gammaproteobacteria bacterium]